MPSGWNDAMLDAGTLIVTVQVDVAEVSVVSILLPLSLDIKRFGVVVIRDKSSVVVIEHFLGHKKVKKHFYFMNKSM